MAPGAGTLGSGRGRRERRRSRGLALGGLVALQALSCGGGGHTLPICPDGNCTVPGNTVVIWRFDHYPDWQFDTDSCTDLHIHTVHVDAVDGAGGVTSMDVGCDQGQATFTGLAPGDYTVSIEPRDVDENPLVSAPSSAMVTAGGPNETTTVTVDVPYTSWTQPYTGTFLFRIAWAGVGCTMAVPQVATQELTLKVNGTQVSGMTDSGQPVDGTPGPCRPLDDQFPQSIKMVPFGPATLLVVGRDSGGNVAFQNQFDTFVGAGISNPTITYDMVDAGVDAAPDGGLDGGLDAGMDGGPDGGSAPLDAGADAPLD